jgi:hypothetical protein
MRQIDEAVKHRGQRRDVTAVGRGAGSDVGFWVHADPVDVMAGIMGWLGEERPLGSAVALPERAQGVTSARNSASRPMNYSRACPRNRCNDDQATSPGR